MLKFDIGSLVVLTIIVCFCLCISGLWTNSSDKLFRQHLHGSGLVGVLSIITGLFIMFQSDGFPQFYTSVILVIVGVFALIGMVIKKNSSHGCDDPTAYPIYMIIIILILMLCLWPSIFKFI